MADADSSVEPDAIEPATNTPGREGSHARRARTLSANAWRHVRSQWLAIAIVVLPVVAYVVVMRRFEGLPPFVAKFESVLPQLLLCAAAIVPLAARQPTGRWLAAHRRSDVAAAGGLTICLVVCVTPALLSWLEGRWGYHRIAGVVPWSDASGYHTGGAGLLDTGRLDLFNMRRPMNAGFYATRLAVTGGNFWYAMLIQAAVVAVCAFVFLRTLARQFGLGAALAAAAVLYAFIGESLDQTMSEPLGFSIGCLSAAMIVHAAVHIDRLVLCVGLFTLGLALNIRAGEMFVLVSLLVWFAADETIGRRLTIRSMSAAIAAVVGSFVPTFILNAQFGVPGGSSNSNFSYTLYGLALGGTGWTSYRERFDLTAFDTEAQLSDAVYRAAFDEIRANPWNLVIGLKRGLENHLNAGLFGFMDGMLSSIAFALLVLGAARLLMSRDGRRLGAMCLAAWAGMLASVPFIFDDGGFRTLAATVPLMAVLPAAGAGFLARAGTSFDPGRTRSLIVIDESAADADVAPSPDRRRLLLGAGAFSASVLVVAPTLVVAVHPRPSPGAVDCSDGEVAAVARVGEAAPHVSILPEGGRSRDFGELTLAEFRSDPTWGGIDISRAFPDVPAGSFLQLAPNLLPDGPRSVIVVAPLDILPPDLTVVAMCGRPFDDPTAAQYGMIQVDSFRRVPDDG